MNYVVRYIYISIIALIIFLLIPKPLQASTTYYIHPDNLGSTSMVTDESGHVVSKRTYYPYGETRNSEGNSPSEREYTGQVSDMEENSLYYYNARYYNPQIAKFTQADSMNDNINKYSYVDNNPINYIDPSGNEKRDPNNPDNSQDSCIENPLLCLLNWYFKNPSESKFFQGISETKENLPQLSSSIDLLNPNLATKITIRYTWSKFAEPSYYYQSNLIILPTEEQTREYVNNFNKSSYKDIPNNYGIIFLHEARHFWQDIYDPQGNFTEFVYEEIKNTNLINAGFYIDLNSSGLSGLVFWNSNLENSIALRPHGAKRLLEIGNYEIYKVDWTNTSEVDAIIAETMVNPQLRDSIKNNYPHLWNMMVSRWGYFDPYQFQFVYESPNGGGKSDKALAY